MRNLHQTQYAGSPLQDVTTMQGAIDVQTAIYQGYIFPSSLLEPHKLWFGSSKLGSCQAFNQARSATKLVMVLQYREVAMRALVLQICLH